MTVISGSLFTRPASIASFRVARAAAVGALVAAVVIGTAISASAHVGVLPDSTVSGHGAQLTFRVPDESDTANTIKLVVTLPQDRPFTDVSTQPCRAGPQPSPTHHCPNRSTSEERRSPRPHTP